MALMEKLTTEGKLNAESCTFNRRSLFFCSFPTPGLTYLINYIASLGKTLRTHEWFAICHAWGPTISRTNSSMKSLRFSLGCADSDRLKVSARSSKIRFVRARCKRDGPDLFQQ